MNRWRCEECDAIVNEDQLLSVPNPFDPEDTISGCPRCKTANQIAIACDVPDCSNVCGHGWPSAGGYRQTCGMHYHMEQS